MGNSFRLKADEMFKRPEEAKREPPLRIVFLSVEGNKTEQNYFEWIEKYREELDIKSKVHVHSLRRAKSDTLSAPQHVLELLEEYIEIRESEVLPSRIRDVIPSEYTDDFVKQYIEDPRKLDAVICASFEMLLSQASIDLEYDYFLKEYHGEYDVFGVVIDRDYDTHTVSQMKEIYDVCKEKGYHYFVTTPCIEFWLLMHLVNIKDEYEGEIQEFRDNKKISNKHTFVSKKVSEIAGHSKTINENVFKKYYLPKVDFAIEQANNYFSTNIDELIGNDETEDTKKGELGSNLTELFKLLREM